MLWLALHFPHLSLDVFHYDPASPDPWAVIDQRGAMEYVLACNPAAAAAGIRIGMQRSAAWVLAGQLRVSPRRRDLEQQALQQLAGWALQFTPTVTMAQPTCLLLEIEGSLAYFGGYPALLQRIQAALGALERVANIGCAPTPLAASWCAISKVSTPIRTPTELPAALAPLPVEVLPLPAHHLQDLQRLGIRQLQQLLALPRTGLARRFGQELPSLLDQALGHQPDPREPYQPPLQFTQRKALAWPVESTEPLLFVGRQLSIALSAYLRGVGCGVQQVTFQLDHGHRRPTPLVMGLGQPTRQVDDLVAVLREQLTQLELVAPVEAVTLAADALTPLAAAPLDLFGHATQQANTALLRARLAARLGHEAVRQLIAVDDHRPEQAWSTTQRQHRPMGSTLPAGERPGWLAAEPIPLAVHAGVPWYGEPLHCQGEAERIEAGWWAPPRVVRDYWIAHGVSGRRYWLFQDRASLGWFLHGWFD